MWVSYAIVTKLNGVNWDTLAEGFSSEQAALDWFYDNENLSEWDDGYSAHLVKWTDEEIKQLT